LNLDRTRDRLRAERSIACSPADGPRDRQLGKRELWVGIWIACSNNWRMSPTRGHRWPMQDAAKGVPATRFRSPPAPTVAAPKKGAGADRPNAAS